MNTFILTLRKVEKHWLTLLRKPFSAAAWYKPEGVFTMQCLSYFALALCKPLEMNVPTLHCSYDAPSCPWRQLMLHKMTKLAEIPYAFSSQAEQFFYNGYIFTVYVLFCQHHYNIVGKESIAQPYRIILRYAKQGFCIAMLGCAFYCPRL